MIGTTKLPFSRIRSSVMPYPNDNKFTVELASTQGGHILNLNKIPQTVPEMQISNFKKISLSFCTLCKNHYNLRMSAEIQSIHLEPKGKYQNQFWGKSDQHSRSYKQFYA